MKLRLFVYGKLKSDQSKSWMIPFSKSTPHTLRHFKMFMRPEGTAGMKRGSINNYVIGEIREVRWAIWPLDKLLLWFLDLNEGTSFNVYKRIKMYKYYKLSCDTLLWTYLFERSTKGYSIIKKWDEKNVD